MDKNIQNDVNTQSDTSTDTSSSLSEQTPVENSTPVTTENSETTTSTGDKTVPYDRFKEVNDNFRATQAELRAIKEQQTQIAQTVTQQQIQNNPQLAQQVEAKNQLKGLLQELAPELGFVSKAEIERNQAIEQVRLEHDRLAQKYSGKDGLPKYDAQAVNEYALNLGMTSAKGLEAAYKLMHNAEITNAQIQRAMQQSRGVQSETSNGTGSANAGVTNDDLKKAAQEGDQNAVHLLLKRRISGK